MTYLPVRVGLVGCGNIAETYISNAAMFAEHFEIIVVSDINATAAHAVGKRHGLAVATPDAVIADPSIEVILNLTIPAAHVPVGLAAIEAGKHVYLEKPLGTSVAEASAMLDRARERGLLIGAAPDTFLGAAHQTARRLIAEGTIGDVVGGSAAVIDRGMEDWHPNPAFFFASGGGPVFDMGPYYLASLVSLLGRVKHVTALSSTGIKERRVGRGAQAGKAIRIEVPTTVNSILRFSGNVDVAFTASWDVWSHRRNHIEIYGTEGSLILPDPNWFGGAVELSIRGAPFEPVDCATQDYGAPNRTLGDGTTVADYRGLGLAKMASAIRTGEAHETNGDFALHILTVIESIANGDGRVICTA